MYPIALRPARIAVLATLLALFMAGAADSVRAQQHPVVAFPGNYGQALGLPSWDPADPGVRATDDDGDGVFTLTVTLPRGDYEFKVAVGGAWDENYGRGGLRGGENIPLHVGEEAEVVFTFRPADSWIGATVAGVDAVVAGEPVTGTEAAAPALGDGLIDGAAIRHESRSDLYRTPFGAQPVGGQVTLRLRTARGDVEGVRLLVDELSQTASSSLPMTRVAVDDQHDWWEATLALGEEIAIYNYKFEVADGSTTLYYADDATLDGGAGALFETRPALSQGWDIYAYQPDFAAPAWAADAIIYQIFPDRFRNGEPSNDPQVDDWGYPGERAHAFPITPWNTIVPDPDPNDPSVNPWHATWNSTFYGGDLQGIAEKLDYLQSLGVNTLYFTPIHEAVTNHRYDARDYLAVEDSLAVRGDAFASMALFDAFAAEVESRGMRLILDAVPNHTSSDSPMFDRYERWGQVGACESPTSEWRDHYLFEPAEPSGSGVCAGDTDYRGFFNIDSLPQANTATGSVVEAWSGENGIAAAWLQKPGVEGWRVDTVYDVVQVNPHFFEPFREAARSANPDALLIAETWPEEAVRERILGDEFDSTMNYRFAWAVLGFLRDDDFTDTNDFAIGALSASQFDSALRSLQEDYPPAAFATAMNLLDSHDTQRAVRVLDHDPIDYATLSPAANFADGRRRLVLAAVLQFTLPGAPTLYYGDEVGLVGFGVDPLRDDPHNRQPYPWDDEAGYDQLPAWRKQDLDLLEHYQWLGQLRSRYSYLRTGAWTTLLADDAGVYAYLRSDDTGAAVVVVNRSQITQSVGLSLTGWLPTGSVLVDALSGQESSLAATGVVTASVPAMGFQILITKPETTMGTPPAPAIAAVAGGSAVTITVTGAQVGDRIVVYRSLVDGGYAPLTNLAAADDVTVVDADVENGVRYYYRAAIVAANGLLGAQSPAVEAMPSLPIAGALLGGPFVLTHTLSAITPTAIITGLVTVPGLTEALGAQAGLRAELGFLAQNAANWVWEPGSFAGDAGDADLFVAHLLPETTGNSVFRWRFSTNAGRSWTQSDAGMLSVLPSEDSQPPKPPFRLDRLAVSPTSVAFVWRLSRPPDLAGFRVCRADLSAGEGGCATQFSLPKTTNVLTDTTVTSGHTYTYTVRVIDEAFNSSPPSQPITLTAELGTVEVTFQVRAPDGTPPGDVVYIAGDDPAVFGAAWDPERMPMTTAGDGLWQFTTTVEDGAELQYKFTRGSWETVEEWGTLTGLANRKVTIEGGPDGAMLVDNTSTAWGGDAPDETLAIQAWRDR